MCRFYDRTIYPQIDFKIVSNLTLFQYASNLCSSSQIKGKKICFQNFACCFADESPTFWYSCMDIDDGRSTETVLNRQIHCFLTSCIMNIMITFMFKDVLLSFLPSQAKIRFTFTSQSRRQTQPAQYNVDLLI